MVIPYQTAKFKSTNIFMMAIYGPTAKFNSHQYFRLYSNITRKMIIIMWGEPLLVALGVL